MATQQERVLLAETEVASDLVSWFESRGHQVTRVESGEEAWQQASKGDFDLVVLSGILKGLSGFEVCRRLKRDSRTARSTKVFLILDANDSFTRGLARSVAADASFERSAVPDGFEEVLERSYQRPNVDALLEERESAVEDGRLKLDASAMLSAESGGFVDVLTDPETGLFNRMYLLVKLGEEFRKSKRYGHPLSCLLVGLDGFDEVVDLEDGREIAEAAMSQVAGIVLCGSRDIDVCSRVGDSTLLFLLPNTGEDGAKVMASRIFKEIEEAELEGGITARGGLITYPHGDIEDPTELVRAAEARLNIAFDTQQTLVGEEAASIGQQ